MPTEESVESSDAEKVKTKSSEEQIGCEIVSLGAAPVKQEPEDEAVYEVDATVEEESNPITFGSVDGEVVQMGSPASDVMRRLDYFGNVETIVSEESAPDVKEEAVVEGGPSLTPHSMLLRSLSAAKHSAAVGDMSPSRLADGAVVTRTGDEADGKLIYCLVSFLIYLHEQSVLKKVGRTRELYYSSFNILSPLFRFRYAISSGLL